MVARSSADSSEPRKLRLWLILGVYCLPAVFAWFLLRPGYSRDAQLGAFLLMGFSLLTAVARLSS